MKVKQFIRDALLKHHNESLDTYKAMKLALDVAFPESEATKRITRYILLTNAIRVHLKVGCGKWGTASREQLDARTKIESGLTVILRSGFVKDFKQTVSLVPDTWE